MSIIAPSRGDLESVHNNPFLGPKPSAMAPFGTSATLATHSTLDKTRIERLSQQDAIASITSWRKRVDNAPRVNESTRNERDRDALTPLNTNTSIPPRSGTLFKQPAKPSTLNSIPKPAAIPDVFEADHSQIRERSVSGKSVLNTINPNKRGREVVSNHVNGVKKVKTEHQSQEEAWRMKWLKIFPTLIFYFELGTEGAGKCYENRVKSMGAKVDAFFSSRVTHLVAKSIASPKKSIPPPISRKNAIKESSKNPFLDDTGAIDLVSKAEALGMKVWTVEKLLNMLNMLAPVDTPPQNDSLHTLLEDERIHGTRERDSTAPRPDHYYFKPGSKYILIEDATGRSRPIMMKECNVTKDGPEWPVLHERFLRPSSSNQCTIDPSKIRERAWCLYVERKPFEGEQPPNCDIKRSTSLRSLPSTPKLPVIEAMPYQNASGNSVVLTSNIASTSAANPSPGTYGQNAMGQYKDRALMQMNKRVQVLKGNARLAAAKRDSVTEANIAELTSRRASTGSTQSSAPVMPPKTFLSHFQLAGMLEQARQPIREKDISYEARMANRAKVESGSKGREQETAPGYCENCRMRYNDLSLHIISKKHRKFATSAENFASLDRLLIMLARPANPKLCQPDYPPCDAEHEKDDECECCARWNERLDEEIQGEVYEQSDGSGESEEFERQSEGSEEGTSQSEETDRLEGLTEQSGSPVSQQSGSEE